MPERCFISYGGLLQVLRMCRKKKRKTLALQIPMTLEHVRSVMYHRNT
jgi:hypothetical protein